MKLLSIVILNYNAAHVLKPCLESLEAYGDWLKQNVAVYVADNASSDGSMDMVRQNFPWVHAIDNGGNLGFAKGNNVVLRQVDSDYVLLLNPDTIVPPETIPKCIQFLKDHSDCGAVTCKVEFPDGRLDPDCHRGFPTPWASLCYFSGLEKTFPHSKLFGQYHLTDRGFTTTHEIDACVGAFMMMPKAAMDKVGLMDETFFFYGEDIDWCYRFKENGYKIFYDPECKIIHYKGVSSGIRKETQNITTATKESKRRIKLASVDAMRIFYDKHYKQQYPFFVTWLVHAGIWAMKQKRLRSV